MKYVGSKNRISKYIVPILQDCIDKNSIEIYYEPFVGGANLIDKIHCKERIGNDIHPQLIAMFNELQKGWQPPSHISEEEYNKVRENKELYPDYYVGYVGFNSTFGAKYFGGYARGFKADGVTPRDQSNEAYRNLMKQLPDVMDVKFLCSDFLNNEYCNLKNALIYADPPYQNTTKYSTKSFNYEAFWNWCRKMSKHNKVFISEYSAPNDFECIWSKEHLANFDCNRGDDTKKKIRIEKLFTYSGELNNKPVAKLKDVTIYRQDSKGYDEKDFDVRMCYWGDGSAGKILKDDEHYSAEYKIKINNEELREDIIEVLTTFDWKEYLNCIAMRKIQQFHIINVLKENVERIK